MRPIHPIMPAIVTLKALIKVATKITKILTLATFMPRLLASSSPKLSAFKYLPPKANNSIPANIGRIEI